MDAIAPSAAAILRDGPDSAVNSPVRLNLREGNAPISQLLWAHSMRNTNRLDTCSTVSTNEIKNCTHQKAGELTTGAALVCGFDLNLSESGRCPSN